ncbi:MAG: glycosyltransferase family 2 protein [Cyclobacteriaceae bacterium]|nr:glycosyltransferase family 2 protein [Cyclobacteriaceae bacterium]
MISIICPVFNEEGYVGFLLETYSKMAPVEKELLVIDGGSTDRTCAIVSDYMRKDSSVRLLENPNRYVPYALNLALPHCKGDYIVRWDAHTAYAPDYLTAVLATFARTGADIVGGPMRAVGENSFQRAVAKATSSRFGVGNSSFHFEEYEGLTDSVYLGAWKRSVFEKIGHFDEQMWRNQDDEFHYRAKAAGLKIYQSPVIRSIYYPRNSVRSLFTQYFGYGLFKPLVLQKVRSQLRLRHLIPALFVAYLLSLPFLIGLLRAWAFSPLVTYVLFTIGYVRRGDSWPVRIAMIAVYPTLHIAYGLGFWVGLFRKPTL